MYSYSCAGKLWQDPELGFSVLGSDISIFGSNSIYIRKDEDELLIHCRLGDRNVRSLLIAMYKDISGSVYSRYIWTQEDSKCNASLNKKENKKSQIHNRKIIILLLEIHQNSNL